MSDWEIQKFDRSYDRSKFDCGTPLLTDWLTRQVSQYERRDLSRTYVAVRFDEKKVLGYYAISNHRVSFESLPRDQAKGLPKIDIPVMLLGRLAVDKTVQGEGLGSFLLIDALRRAVRISDQIGIRAVEVNAIDNSARKFYLRYGFVPLRDDSHHLFLPIRVIRKLKLPPL
jgi:GNAT superfamily N-acetyltransferase